MRHFLLFLILAASLVSAGAAEKVRVVTRNLEPFSFEQDGRRVGFAMELWDEVARTMHLEYDVTVADSAKKIVEAVQTKSADVGVGAISITAEREAVIDFSQPFYQSGLQIMVFPAPSGLKDTIWQVMAPILNWKSLGSVGGLILLMLIVSHLVWMYEHPVNEEMWPKSYRAGMWESFWWSISIFLVGGADNKGPVGVGGRIVAIVWMLLSIVFIALLTAMFTATITVNSLKSDISSPRDLPGKKVATIGGSTAESWLQKHGVTDLETFPDIKKCVEALKNGEVKAVVFDEPIIKYELKQPGNQELAAAGDRFDPGDYGFALQQDSTLREGIDQALLTLRENGFTEKLQQKWFGDDSKSSAGN
ncbi:transporter substrate-binding domain-containing protein [soil metagenome]